MKKLIQNIKKYPISYLVTTLIGLAVGFVFFALFFFWLRGISIVGAIDGTGVAGAVLLGVFGLVWLSRNGAFDTMSYGFSQMFASMFGRKANKYNDFSEYKEQKNTKREVGSLSYIALAFDGFLYLIAFAVLEIVLHTLY